MHRPPRATPRWWSCRQRLRVRLRFNLARSQLMVLRKPLWVQDIEEIIDWILGAEIHQTTSWIVRRSVPASISTVA
jgi:hypothetical protein